MLVAQGRVQNGVVVLGEGVHLPEGQTVTVVAPSADEAKFHGIMDIPPVSLGAIVCAPGPDDDILGEMLEGRS